MVDARQIANVARALTNAKNPQVKETWRKILNQLFNKIKKENKI